MHAISSIFQNIPETTDCIKFPQFLSHTSQYPQPFLQQQTTYNFLSPPTTDYIQFPFLPTIPSTTDHIQFPFPHTIPSTTDHIQFPLSPPTIPPTTDYIQFPQFYNGYTCKYQSMKINCKHLLCDY